MYYMDPLLRKNIRIGKYYIFGISFSIKTCVKIFSLKKNVLINGVFIF